MSLINDALKQARKPPPQGVPGTLTPLQPAGESSRSPAWLLLAMAVLLVVVVVVAVVFIGKTVTHPTPLQNASVAAAPAPAAQPVAAARESAVVATAPQPATVTPPAAPATLPAAQPQPVNPPAPAKPAPPKLQGIFYLSKSVSAIVDGKTVRPGDQLHQYRVKAISRDAVTLVGPDLKELVLSMEN